MFDMYRPKKKRAVDPNAPPRPNLLSHEKVLKDTKVTLEQLQHENQQLKHRLEALESKILNQTNYLNTLHQYVHSKFKSNG
jgi:predicted RNase H-like nuclease (RuvC/YqgF family)